MSTPGKRLAVFFDGTWNKPEDNTNVWRLSLMLADKGEDGVPQMKFYDEDVGTHWFDRISGVHSVMDYRRVSGLVIAG